MNTVELLQFSLEAAFDVLSCVTADLTQKQADWRPPGTANTIGSIYSHILTYVDYYVRNYFIELPIRSFLGWFGKLGTESRVDLR